MEFLINNNFAVALTEVFLFASLLVLVLLCVFSKRNKEFKAASFTLFILVSAIIFLATSMHNLSFQFAFNEMFVTNRLVVISKYLILFSAITICILTFNFIRRDFMLIKPEFYIIMLLSVFGMMIMVSAGSFLVLYVGLELQSLALYILAAFNREDSLSTEASLKYFITGALASGVMLFGISMVYGATGDLSIYTPLFKGPESLLGFIGLVLIVIGLLFKVSAVPFHMWTPDVYQGAPTVVTSFFAMTPKVASIVVLLRLMFEHSVQHQNFQQILVVVSVLSMAVGAFGAIWQTNIKRLMAYSSIGHVGFMLLGIAAGGESAVSSIILYLMIYLSMTVGVFACVMMMKKNHENFSEEIEDLAGLARYRPMMALCIAVLMFSMAGIPPLAGFFAKFYIFSAAIKSGLYMVSVIGMIFAVISAYYYIKIVKVMYFDEEKVIFETVDQQELQFVAYSASLYNAFFFLVPSAFVELANYASAILV